MPDRSKSAPLRIAVSPGSLAHPLAGLLALHREQEPDSLPSFSETGNAGLIDGIKDDKYDVGVSLEPPSDKSLVSAPIWRDEVAVALPTRHPLLERGEIELAELARFPLVLWSPDRCESLASQVNTLLNVARRPLNVEHWAVSFEMLITMVAAGYGAGLAAKSRIVGAREAGVIMRPLAGVPCWLTTYLVYPAVSRGGVAERFVERAKSALKTIE